MTKTKDRFDSEAIEAWTKTYGKIQSVSPDGLADFGMIDFPPNEIQQDFLDKSKALRGHAVVDATIKPRQCGFSTLMMLWITALAMVHPGIAIIVILPTESDAKTIQRKWKFIQNHLATIEGSGVIPETDNPDEFAWSNGSFLRWFTVGGSHAVAENVGRGGSWNFVWIPEMAYPVEAALMSAAWDALKPALKSSGASVVIDSTPNGPTGRGAAYADMIHMIDAGEIKGEVFFWPWWKDPKNRSEIPGTPQEFALTLTPEERALIMSANLAFQQIQFRREESRGKPGMTARQAMRAFLNAYPERRCDVFVHADSGGLFERSMVDRLRVKSLEKSWPKPLSNEELGGLLLESPLDLLRETKGSKQGFFRAWQAPLPGVRYFAGGDGSDGRIGGDPQSFAIEHEDGEVVARLHCRVSPTRFAAYCQRILTWYNRGHARIERQYGEIIHDRITRRMGDAIMDEETFPGELEILREPYSRVWIKATTGHNRARIVEAAFRAINFGEAIKDDEALAEMENLHRDANGKIRARGKGNDDYFMSLGLAEMARDQVLKGERKAQKLSKDRRTPRRKTSKRFRYIGAAGIKSGFD